MMRHETPFPRWIAQVRRQAIGYILLGIIAAGVIVWVSTHFPRGPIFAGITAHIDAAAPWILIASVFWIAGWICWLASTYLATDWWLTRWARAHGHEVT